jgi:hypothetical protein
VTKLIVDFRNFAKAPKNSTRYLHCVYVFCMVLKKNSDHCTIQHERPVLYNRCGVFTARYVLSPYVKQTRYVFKGLIEKLEEEAITAVTAVVCG